MRNTPTIAPQSRLFHAIVVVGLSTAATGCGTSGQSGASKDAGEGGIQIHRSDAGDAAPDCGPAANPGLDGGCWPLFV
jgi:hypothetical protein